MKKHYLNQISYEIEKETVCHNNKKSLLLISKLNITQIQQQQQQQREEKTMTIFYLR